MGEQQAITVALAGNPNSGKTTIFNELTGARQHVGNYSGVTVEKKVGQRQFDGKNLLITDLPGTYSLTTYSPEEVVARNFIVQEKPKVVVDVLDAANLERNLNLAVQLMELNCPIILVLNMVDVAETRKIIIDEQKLAALLKVKVVRTVGSHAKGMDQLLQALVSPVKTADLQIDYGEAIEAALRDMLPLLTAAQGKLQFPVRWLALKLLENDRDIKEQVLTAGGEAAVREADRLRLALEQELGQDAEMAIASLRYQFINEIYQKVASPYDDDALTTSDKIDRVLTNRVLGIPIFLGLMWLIFNLVFTVGKVPQDLLTKGMGALGTAIGQSLPEGDFRSLVADGIFGGVGAVVSFLPLILILFFAISLLEDTGYMARAAFVMDRVMRKVGLHGKSFIPLLLGFGCGVPAIMGTRTLENPRDRMVTILVTPLMSCSARLPIYSVLIAAFFEPEIAGNVLFSIYLLGVVLALLVARLFRTFLFKGSTESFIMELPPYHLPTFKSVLIHMWERSILYLKKAGTIILAASIIMWFLTNYPSDVNYSKDYDALQQGLETFFEEQVETDIREPLQLASINDNPQLAELIAKMTAIESEFKEQTDDLADDDPKVAELEQEKQEKLAALNQEGNSVYQYASHYMELKADLGDAKETLDNEKNGEKVSQSYAGSIGRFLEPVMAPLGFNWKMNVALIAGFSAKEVVVSTLGTIYSVGGDAEKTAPLQDALAADPTLNPLIAYTFMIFCLVYSPCLAAIATVRRETNSWKWAAFTAVYSTGLAWVMAFLTYQIGLLSGFGS